jgi:hypothetical protein
LHALRAFFLVTALVLAAGPAIAAPASAATSASTAITIAGDGREVLIRRPMVPLLPTA